MGILPNCKDPTLKALKSVGYNVVLLPRVDLRPTQDGVYRTFKPTSGGSLVAESVASPYETDLLLRE